MPTYNVSCVPCAMTAEVLVPFIERDRVSHSCGVRMERLWNWFPRLQADWKPWEDVADPSGTFPMRYGGRSEHRELVKQRAGDHNIQWVPGR